MMHTSPPVVIYVTVVAIFVRGNEAITIAPPTPIVLITVAATNLRVTSLVMTAMMMTVAISVSRMRA